MGIVVLILNQRTKFSLSHHIIVWIILVCLCLSTMSYALYKTVESIEFQKNTLTQTTNQSKSVNSSSNRSSKKTHKKPSRTDNTKKLVILNLKQKNYKHIQKPPNECTRSNNLLI